MNHVLRPLSRRVARIPAKVGAVFFDAVLPWLIIVAAGLSIAVRVVACNLPPATVKSLTSAGVTLACSIASASVPAADRNLTATICQDAEVIAPDVLAGIWEAAAAEHRASGLAPATVQPQGNVPQKAVQCAGRNVMAVPAETWALAQVRADKVKGCRP